MSDKEPKTTVDAGEETKLFHERYLIAVNNPLRRRILEALTGGCSTIEELGTKTKLDREALGWHLNVLEVALCVEKEEAHGNLIYKLTQAGRVIEFME